jgi:hypothetical protein
MGALSGANGNRLQPKSSEVSIAVATNQVFWKSQRLEAERDEASGEQFASSVTALVKTAFGEIVRHGTDADRASLVVQLNELLAEIDSKTAREAPAPNDRHTA